jgi:UDP-3-O-[3-hydroxymyristoyl] glucosamine N-acyltransferase
MADARFFQTAGPFSVRALAEIAGARLAEEADAERVIADVAPLDTAGPEHVGFLDNPRYVPAFTASRAGACVVHPAFAARAPQGMALLLTESAYRGYALIAQAFHPAPPAPPGIHPAAAVDPAAFVDPTAAVEAGAVIAARAAIGAQCRIGANAVVGEGVVVGDRTMVGAGASLTHCLIGRRVTVLPGARIGQEGFGFARTPEGPVKIPQLGRVIVEDDVEIGANTTIDRGSGPDTVIGRGSMIDNLVQIGHNVTIGPHSVIVAQAGIAGSTRLGRAATLGAQAGIAGHLAIGAGARIAAKSGVMRDVKDGEEVCGAPAVPIRQFWRQVAWLMRFSEKKGK